MIIGGLQTGNTRWLAAHLQNEADNEDVEVAEVSGTVADDVDGALAEFDAIAAGTRAKEGVYAAFINPPVPLTRAQYMRAIAVLEACLGLIGQPRIILFHIKRGREHCHAAWSRIDAKRMRAIQLSHDRQKLRRCAQELAAEFGTELPPGLARDGGLDRLHRVPQRTRAEKAAEALSGLNRTDRREVIMRCYRSSGTALGFVRALDEAGFMLARGDRRSFVVVDIAGDVHSLAKQIDGAKTKDVRKKLEGIALAHLPPVERAKALMLQRAAAQQDVVRANEEKKALAVTEFDRLKTIQSKRRLALDQLWQRMKIRHSHEWKVLQAHIKAEEDRRIARRHWLAAGLAAYLRKIIFLRELLEYYEKRKKRLAEEYYEVLREAVRLRHKNEEAALRRRYEALARLVRREWFSFEIKHRDVVQTSGRLHAGQTIESGIYVRRITKFEVALEETPRFTDLGVSAVLNPLHEHRHNAEFVKESEVPTAAPLRERDKSQWRSMSAWKFQLNRADITTAKVPPITVSFGNGQGISVSGAYVSIPINKQ